MIGWRRRAKEARESTISQERQYELVSQTLMENFGPLGSFAITRRSASDTDDIFHTALAKSVAHDIVANLAEHGITMKSNGHGTIAPLAPVETVPVPRQLARAVASATARVAPVAALAPAAPAAPAVPAYPTVAAGVAIGAAPMIDGPDPRDDDALRALVAHHAEVTDVVTQRQAEARSIAI
ncbi:hypothetical protein [Herbiconiux ginsengi]|uniref:Uncharacterized protein n=1 Tax=Herbiconiux ginsengi TaxID=381665 RepID=A0A1H3SZC6_9MICO|nr:hypothetical protein [Herbiconiux ginsengi]SDZ42931.1 hypothetical protein SAMN05216554_3816 [Herbiconiux ginsengi]